MKATLETQFTPGPWDISTHADNNQVVIRSQKGVIANLEVDNWPETIKDIPANARLMSLAPEMYKVIEEFIEFLKDRGDFVIEDAEEGNENPYTRAVRLLTKIKE